MAAQPSALEQKLATLEKKLADLKSGAKRAETPGEQDVLIHRTERSIREVKQGIEDEKPKQPTPKK